MASKIDLEELERKARAVVAAVAPRQGVYTDRPAKIPAKIDWVRIAREAIAAASPVVVLALIARIRELEASLADACNGWREAEAIATGYGNSPGASTPGASTQRRLDDVVAVLARGVVLP